MTKNYKGLWDSYTWNLEDITFQLTTKWCRSCQSLPACQQQNWDSNSGLPDARFSPRRSTAHGWNCCTETSSLTPATSHVHQPVPPCSPSLGVSDAAAVWLLSRLYQQHRAALAVCAFFPLSSSFCLDWTQTLAVGVTLWHYFWWRRGPLNTWDRLDEWPAQARVQKHCLGPLPLPRACLLV